MWTVCPLLPDSNVVVAESIIANNSSVWISLTAPLALTVTNSLIYGNGAYGINGYVRAPLVFSAV